MKVEKAFGQRDFWGIFLWPLLWPSSTTWFFFQDLPTFTTNMERFINDLRYYKLCNASLSVGSVNLVLWYNLPKPAKICFFVRVIAFDYFSNKAACAVLHELCQVIDIALSILQILVVWRCIAISILLYRYRRYGEILLIWQLITNIVIYRQCYRLYFADKQPI